MATEERVQDELSRQARAGETRKRRTRDKLIHAADYVLREDGLSATVEAITEEAGVSTATFYSFYSSRNALCVDAFTELVIAVLEQTVTPPQSVRERLDVLANLVRERRVLARAAMIGRFEDSSWSIPEGVMGIGRANDFVERLGCLLWMSGQHEDERARKHYDFTKYHAAALEAIECIVIGTHIETINLD